jgi:hypothetical protein
VVSPSGSSAASSASASSACLGPTLLDRYALFLEWNAAEVEERGFHADFDAD